MESSQANSTGSSVGYTATAPVATQAPSSPGTTPSARKCLICHARLLPKATSVWIQGVVTLVKTQADADGQKRYGLFVDDGSGIAFVQANPSKPRLKSVDLEAIGEGSYIMVASPTVVKLRHHKLGLSAHVVRDLSAHAAFHETLWNLEVVDSYLHYHDKESENVTT